MSAFVRLSSKLPGDPETNGIDAQSQRLIDSPEDLLVCVVWVDVQRITDDIDTRNHVPTVRIRRIEPIADLGREPDELRRIVAAAEEKRTGRTAIPFGMVEISEGYDSGQLSIDDVADDEDGDDQ